jgi:hypothetical protein
MDSALIDQTSEQFLGQWKLLVSTSNWQKGRIIHDWREALRESGLPSSEYSDESWSRRVGNVTPQHVGRLRRVFERFDAARDDYPGLFWSHFQAALDWDDAEMYLEGAVQSGWSISEMRQKRWELNGGLEAEHPTDDEASVAAPWDEDAEPDDASGEVISGTLGAVHSPERTRSSDDEEGYDRSEFDDAADGGESEYDVKAASATPVEIVRPFANLPSLPADVNDAFEAYKLCILRHKLAGWQDISRADLLASLDALKQLALAPAES